MSHGGETERILIAPRDARIMLMILSFVLAGCAQPAFDVDSVSDFRGVRSITNPSKLALLATESKNVGVRSAAMDKIDDPQILTRIAMDDECWQIGLAAANALHDQKRLTHIAMSSNSWQVRKALLHLVTSQALLIEIATTDDSWQVRTAAVRRVMDQQVLARIALTNAASETDDRQAECYIAARNLIDPDLLAEVAMNAHFAVVRSVAVTEVNDSQVLLVVALAQDRCAGHEGPPYYCTAPLFATRKLNDQRLLTRIAIQSECSSARRRAVESLQDADTLRRIAADENETSEIRESAVRRLAEIGSSIDTDPDD